ncbi:DNA-binding transcriptional regulator, AcrR family [Parafrankia irregularis]|uniref:DNA-binding transcriptional regulator, AcrR family n=1 Tax=Parafrankia irregularis TaxID=795642 RepID=A0A0S4QZV1_9ACTN|nr:MULTISPECIES: TetR/AcrR family transcriptional regulator [Parafrankia]MBE3204883.1 TetR/AcrR family transcriptional regulator [Parafrankia sp. CH37]CUU60654.1 DNA-binding transcriptional regulator, AcrR family [Parafrankia irregularis]
MSRMPAPPSTPAPVSESSLAAPPGPAPAAVSGTDTGASAGTGPGAGAEAPATPRLRQDAARNRDRIITAACEVFAERGIDANVEEIARRAGVGVGTLYRRFPTKEHLLAQLAEDLLRALLDDARAELGATDGAGLERTLRRCAAVQVSKRGYMMKIYEAAQPDEPRMAFREALAELLVEAQQAGTIRPDVTITDIVMLMWSLRGVVDMSAPAGLSAVERYLDLLLAGLRPGAAPLAHPPVPNL